jgi:hypothetical protein
LTTAPRQKSLDEVAEMVKGEGTEFRTVGEGTEVQDDRQGPLAVDVGSVVLQHVEALVLDLLARSAPRGELDDLVRVDPEVCDEADAVGQLAVGADDLDLDPVEGAELARVDDEPALGALCSRMPSPTSISRLDRKSQ